MNDNHSNAIKVAVTGAAGQICYNLLFRIASGEVFGNNQKIILHLLEIEPAMHALQGVVLELQDCAFPCLIGIKTFSDEKSCFDGVSYAVLVGSFPRKEGMKRSDLLSKNAQIFKKQGQALLKAASDIKVIVVGNPCNTNALIALKNAQDIPAMRFSAMTALDENRAKYQLYLHSGIPIENFKNLAIWGNHSLTMVADYQNVTVSGQKLIAKKEFDQSWLASEFFKKIGQRGAKIIQARKKSSAASAANACIDHIKSLITTTDDDDCFSCAFLTKENPYGIAKDLVFSMPMTFDGSIYSVKTGFVHDKFLRNKIFLSQEELLKEKDTVKDLLI